MSTIIKYIFSSFIVSWIISCFLIVQFLTLWIAYDMHVKDTIYLEMKDKWCIRSIEWISEQAQYFTKDDLESQRRMLVNYTETEDSRPNIYARLIDNDGKLISTPVKSRQADHRINIGIDEDIDFTFFAGSQLDRYVSTIKSTIHSRPITGTPYTILISALPGNFENTPVSLIIACIIFQVMMISITAVAVRRKMRIITLRDRVAFLENENRLLIKKVKSACHIPTRSNRKSEQRNHPLSSTLPDVEFDDNTDFALASSAHNV